MLGTVTEVVAVSVFACMTLFVYVVAFVLVSVDIVAFVVQLVYVVAFALLISVALQLLTELY